MRWVIKNPINELTGKPMNIAVIPGERKTITFLACSLCDNYDTFHGAQLNGWQPTPIVCNLCLNKEND